MRLLKRSQRQHAKVSIVLLDWSVRESFHLLHYLRTQSVPRDAFEVLLIEYYSRISAAAQRYGGEVDTWALLEMPDQCYYHKHLMYNAGIALSKGEVCVFCDSDAMVKGTFVNAILGQFEHDPGIVLHIDQFRNMRRDFYPFCFPSFEEVTGPGCINNAGGKTAGLVDAKDPLHERNYGACMCARRNDLIAIGGADEHVDYLGHICGPYDMTFRLVNHGRREIWHPSEFMYHTWHPGQAGVNNYLGPHDGRHMSTTALESLTTGRVRPFQENRAIAYVREHGAGTEAPGALIISEERARQWLLVGSRPIETAAPLRTILYRGFRIEPDTQGYAARLLLSDVVSVPELSKLAGASVDELKRQIDDAIGRRVRMVSAAGSAYVLFWRLLTASRVMMTRAVRVARTLPGRITHAARAFVRRTQDRWHRFFLERRFLAGTLGSLLVNLYFIGRVRQSSRDLPPPVVMVDRRAVSSYLRSMSTMRLIAPLDVIRVDSREDVERWVTTLANGDWTGHVIVGRDFYMRHYGSLSKLRAMKRLVVA